MSVVAPSQSQRSVAKSASNIHLFRAAIIVAIAHIDGTYSNWYCSRFSLDSLFTDCGVLTTFSSLCIANIRIISIRCIVLGFFLLLAPQKNTKSRTRKSERGFILFNIQSRAKTLAHLSRQFAKAQTRYLTHCIIRHHLHMPNRDTALQLLSQSQMPNLIIAIRQHFPTIIYNKKNARPLRGIGRF